MFCPEGHRTCDRDATERRFRAHSSPQVKHSLHSLTRPGSEHPQSCLREELDLQMRCIKIRRGLSTLEPSLLPVAAHGVSGEALGTWSSVGDHSGGGDPSGVDV